jgi:hypothetical protein
MYRFDSCVEYPDRTATTLPPYQPLDSPLQNPKPSFKRKWLKKFLLGGTVNKLFLTSLLQKPHPECLTG